jgi:hypothetical protein
VVNERSGCLDLSERIKKYPLTKTHFNMNKFSRPSEEDFLMVREVVEDMAEGACTQTAAKDISGRQVRQLDSGAIGQARLLLSGKIQQN